MTMHSSTLAWKIPRATVHGVAKSWTRLSDFTFIFRIEKKQVQAGQERRKREISGFPMWCQMLKRRGDRAQVSCFLRFFFDVNHFFKVFIEFSTILLLFDVSVFWPRGMWYLSSLTRNWTQIPCLGRWSPNHWSTREPQDSRLPELMAPVHKGQSGSAFSPCLLPSPSYFSLTSVTLLSALGTRKVSEGN